MKKKWTEQEDAYIIEGKTQKLSFNPLLESGWLQTLHVRACLHSMTFSLVWDLRLLCLIVSHEPPAATATGPRPRIP